MVGLRQKMKKMPDISHSIWRLDGLVGRYRATNSVVFADAILKEVAQIQARTSPQEFDRFLEKAEDVALKVDLSYPNAHMIYPAIKSAYETATRSNFNRNEFSDYLSTLHPLPKVEFETVQILDNRSFWKRAKDAALLGLSFFAVGGVSATFGNSIQPLASPEENPELSPIQDLLCSLVPDGCKDPDRDGIPNVYDVNQTRPNIYITIDYFQGSNQGPTHKISEGSKQKIVDAFRNIGVDAVIDTGELGGVFGGQTIRPSNNYTCDVSFISEPVIALNSDCSGIGQITNQTVQGIRRGDFIEDSPAKLSTALNLTRNLNYNGLLILPYFHYILIAQDIEGEDQGNGKITYGIASTDAGFVSLVKIDDNIYNSSNREFIEANFILHEIGHGFGMDHDKNPYSIMNNLEHHYFVNRENLSIEWLPEQGKYILERGLRKSFEGLQWEITMSYVDKLRLEAAQAAEAS
jgi:hypothetical protein